MYELRVLNGYHRGATLLLDEKVHIIGASDDADIVLADPGIEIEHASLVLSSSGWLLQEINGPIRSDESNKAVDILQLKINDFARVGSIWVTVTMQNSAWQDPPHEPIDVSEMEDNNDVLPSDDTEEVLQEDDALVASQQSHENNIDHMMTEVILPERTSSWHRVVIIPVTAVAILSAAAAYALSGHYSSDANGMAGKNRQSDLSISAISVAKNRKLSPPELRAIFRNRLKEVELLDRFNLQLNDDSWSMQAALNEEDTERFNRMLNVFMKTYHIDFPVNVKIGNAESMLPFRIQQVISGSNASIVTDDGRRLYVGDEYRGVRLAAIEGNQLSFTGKNEIDINW